MTFSSAVVKVYISHLPFPNPHLLKSVSLTKKKEKKFAVEMYKM